MTATWKAPCSRCGRTLRVSAKSRPEPTCWDCRGIIRKYQGPPGLPGRPKKPCGTTAAYRRHLKSGETPCQPCRDAHNAHNKRVASRAPAVRPGMSCEHCCEPIPRGYSKFCSLACRMAARADRSLVWPRNCAHCSKPFIGRRHQAITCSAACSDARRKQLNNKSTPRTRNKRHVRRAVEKYTDITAAQEDTMRRKARKCPLCKVSMTDKPLKPNSKHLDHIVPINQGGTHTHGNVRIICMDCNLKRPKDGSDYGGPVTLWAQVPAAIMPPPPKMPAPKPKPAPKPVSMTTCGKCGVQFAQRTWKQTRCADCSAILGRQAVELRRDGAPWDEIAQVIGYSVAGAHLLAQRHGLYA